MRVLGNMFLLSILVVIFHLKTTECKYLVIFVHLERLLGYISHGTKRVGALLHPSNVYVCICAKLEDIEACFIHRVCAWARSRMRACVRVCMYVYM